MKFTIPIQFITFCISANLLFSSSDTALASQSSIIPFQLLPNSRPMLHLGGIQDSSGIQLVTGIQIQPTSNLLLGGVLSPRKVNDDLSIYYHILIGYIPKWKLLKISSNMIQISMHRHRFGDTDNSRWFSFSVMESTHLGSVKLNLCWNRLFTQKWERNTVLISTRIKLIREFYLQPGAVAYFTPEFNYSPFFLLSINI